MNHIQKLLFLTALLSSSMAFGQLTEDPEDRRDQGKDPYRTQTPEGRPLPFGYNYTRYKAPYFTPTTLNQYGGRGFVMYEALASIIPNLYVHGEVESTMIQQKVDQNPLQTASLSLTTPLIGLTYMQPITRRFGVNLTALYNLNANSTASQIIYGSSPFIIRLSFF